MIASLIISTVIGFSSGFCLGIVGVILTLVALEDPAVLKDIVWKQKLKQEQEAKREEEEVKLE